MRIRVYAPSFSDQAAIDDQGFMELPEGSGLAEVYRRLRINPLLRRVVLCTVNYEFPRPGLVLREGDTVSFLSFVNGG